MVQSPLLRTNFVRLTPDFDLVLSFFIKWYYLVPSFHTMIIL